MTELGFWTDGEYGRGGGDYVSVNKPDVFAEVLAAIADVEDATIHESIHTRLGQAVNELSRVAHKLEQHLEAEGKK